MFLTTPALYSRDHQVNLMANDLFHIPQGVATRWATAENPDALPGGGGAANHGRKGSPAIPLAAGAACTLAHGSGPGTIRRIWITISDRSPALLRGLTLRAWWDGAEKPAIEVPLGDFFGVSLGRTAAFESAWFASPEGRSFQSCLPMPFREDFRITLTNESPVPLELLFYEIDFTVGDDHPENTGYLHAAFRREDSTRLRQDFEILPQINGRGRFLGCTLGVIADEAQYGKLWWGEGEVKIYLDSDQHLPTLCGTGTEDYIATGWGQGQFAQQWHGCPVADSERSEYSFYRLHGPDPVYFQSSIRVTIQQIGYAEPEQMQEMLQAAPSQRIVQTGDGTEILSRENSHTKMKSILFERSDDWSAVAYFYLDRPANALPPIADYAARIHGLKGSLEG